MQTIYLVVGVPCAGKTWVAENLAEAFHLVPHDDYTDDGGRGYVPALVSAARAADRPVLAETPFSVSQIMGPVAEYGLTVVPVFILEEAEELRRRYREREGKEIPRGHLTRQETYAQRAASLGAFSGTAEEVLGHLQRVAAG
jgi:hypothetical protein